MVNPKNYTVVISAIHRRPVQYIRTAPLAVIPSGLFWTLVGEEGSNEHKTK